jgi:hypothetical protein
MFDEQQLPIRTQHAGDLAERAFGLLDSAEDESRDDRVHGCIGQG